MARCAGRALVALLSLSCVAGCPKERPANDPGARTLCETPVDMWGGFSGDFAALSSAEQVRARRDHARDLLVTIAAAQRGVTCTREDRGYALVGSVDELVSVCAWISPALAQLRGMGYDLALHRHGGPPPPGPHMDEAAWTATVFPSPSSDLPHYAVGTGIGDGSGVVYVSSQAFTCAAGATTCTWPADARQLR